MSFVTPANGDVIEDQDIDLLRAALTAGSGMVGNQWLGAPAAPTAAIGSAGILTGAYYYAVTFVVLRKTDMTTVLGETFAGTASGTVSPSSQQVNLTAIPTSTNPRCNARRIYRTAAGGSQLKLVTTIADNTSTAYTDNLADASLGANAPTSDSADQSVFSSQHYAYQMAMV